MITCRICSREWDFDPTIENKLLFDTIGCPDCRSGNVTKWENEIETYRVYFRTGGTENFKWHKADGRKDSESAKADVAELTQMGYLALYMNYDLLESIGLPETWDARPIELTDNPCTEAQQRGAIQQILRTECHDFERIDFKELALVCIDQAEYNLGTQEKIEKILED